MMNSDIPDDPSAAADAPGVTLNEKAPAVIALRVLQQIVVDARKEVAHRQYAELDLRKMNELQLALAKNAADQSAVGWLRQMALGWNSKLRGNPALRFRRIFDMLESVKR